MKSMLQWWQQGWWETGNHYMTVVQSGKHKWLVYHVPDDRSKYVAYLLFGSWSSTLSPTTCYQSRSSICAPSSWSQRWRNYKIQCYQAITGGPALTNHDKWAGACDVSDIRHLDELLQRCLPQSHCQLWIWRCLSSRNAYPRDRSPDQMPHCWAHRNEDKRAIGCVMHHWDRDHVHSCQCCKYEGCRKWNGWANVSCSAHKLHLTVISSMGIDQVINSAIVKCVGTAVASLAISYMVRWQWGVK